MWKIVVILGLLMVGERVFCSARPECGATFILLFMYQLFWVVSLLSLLYFTFVRWRAVKRKLLFICVIMLITPRRVLTTGII